MDPRRNDIGSVFVKLASFWRKRLTWVPRPDPSHPHLTPSHTLLPTSDSGPGCVVSDQHPASAAPGACPLHRVALQDPAQHWHPQSARSILLDRPTQSFSFLSSEECRRMDGRILETRSPTNFQKRLFTVEQILWENSMKNSSCWLWWTTFKSIPGYAKYCLEGINSHSF